MGSFLNLELIFPILSLFSNSGLDTDPVWLPLTLRIIINSYSPVPSSRLLLASVLPSVFLPPPLRSRPVRLSPRPSTTDKISECVHVWIVNAVAGVEVSSQTAVSVHNQ